MLFPVLSNTISFLQLFVDKDTLVTALNNAHDTHMLAIDSQEDSISQTVAKDMAVLVKDLSAREIKRNRQKVVEIERYVDFQKEEFDSLEQSTMSYPS